jgi:hypothetical protein
VNGHLDLDHRGRAEGAGTEASAPGPGAVPGQIELTRQEIEHAASCAPCRRAIASRDPSALFSLLSLEANDEASWLGFETRVLAEVRATRRGRGRILDFVLSSGLFRAERALLAGGVSLLAVVAILLRAGAGEPAEPRKLSAPSLARRLEMGILVHGSGADPGAVASLASGVDWVSGAARAVLGEGGPGAQTVELAAVPAGRVAPKPRSTLMLPLERDAGVPAPVESVASATAHIISLSIDAASGPPGPGPGSPARAGREAEPSPSDIVLIVDKGIDI